MLLPVNVGFAAFDCVHTETGQVLYQTNAQEEEILRANSNLRNAALPHRYFPAGTFNAPSLHSPG